MDELTAYLDHLGVPADPNPAVRVKALHEKWCDVIVGLADVLERWAHESEVGGWSTHQVADQRELAAMLREVR